MNNGILQNVENKYRKLMQNNPTGVDCYKGLQTFTNTSKYTLIGAIILFIVGLLALLSHMKMSRSCGLTDIGFGYKFGNVVFWILVIIVFIAIAIIIWTAWKMYRFGKNPWNVQQYMEQCQRIQQAFANNPIHQQQLQLQQQQAQLQQQAQQAQAQFQPPTHYQPASPARA